MPRRYLGLCKLEHVGQVTPCFAGMSSTIDHVDIFYEIYVCCVRGDAARSGCDSVRLVLSHTQKVGTRKRCSVTVTEIEHNVCRRDVTEAFRNVRGGVG